MVQREFGNQGVEVVAINQAAQFSLDDWETFWRSTGALSVIWAQDTNLMATRTYGVTALGTTIIIDRDGQIVYRDHKATSQETLQSEIEKVL